MTTDAMNESNPINPTQLTCRDVETLISGIIDGELERDTRHAAELHLLACDACREKVNRAEALDGLVAAAGERLGPEVLPERVRLGVLGAIERDRARSLRFPAVAWSGWAVAAALALLITAGSLTGWLGAGRQGGLPGPNASLQLAAHERESLNFLRVISRALSGDLTEAEYNQTLAYLRDARDELGESLIDRLLGEEERAALRELSQRPGLTEAQREVLQLADRLLTDLEAGAPIERSRWHTLAAGMQLLPLG